MSVSFTAGAQSPHKQAVSDNFGLSVKQDQSVLPYTKATVEMPERVPFKDIPARFDKVGANKWQLSAGWTLRERDSDDLFNAVVPGTVLTTLVSQGVYPDPYFGVNNLFIPDDLCRKEWEYKIHFSLLDEMKAADRLELLLNGINYKAAVFLNGTKLGAIDGAFVRGRFNILPYVSDADNELVVRIYPPANPGIPHEKSSKTGRGPNGGMLCLDGPTFISSEGWDWVPGVRDRNIGIWQDVQLIASGKVTIGDTKVVSDLPLPDVSYADLTIETCLTNTGDQADEVTLNGKIESIAFSRTVTIPANSSVNVVFSPVTDKLLRINNPRLWMPNGYGNPEVYSLELECVDAGKVSDSQTVDFGIRELTYELTVDSPAGKGRRVVYSPLANYGKASVFNNRMLRDVGDGVSVPSVTSEDGMTVIPDDGTTPYLVISVNGVRVFCRGGNWGMDDMMKDASVEHLEPYLKLHRNAGFNMIRNWTGESTEESFYALCDKYGMLVWNDFWISTEGHNLDPADDDLFMSNAQDMVRRFRNHPCLAIWCPRNEGYATEKLERRISDMLAREDGTRYYSPNSRYCNLRPSGPWHYLKDVSEYFTYRAKGFNTELGSPSIPTASSIRKFMAPEDQWPISEVWCYHDLHPETIPYVAAVSELYGEPSGLDEFCKKVQMLNYDNYRAMFESWNSHKWNNTSGVLLWMSHPAWPSMEWQVYSWDYETYGSFFGSKKACEPFHIQMSPADRTVMVVNTGVTPRHGVLVTAECYGLDGRKLSSKSAKGIETGSDEVVDVFKLDIPSDRDVVIVRLKAVAADGSVSINDYLVSNKESRDFKALEDMPQALVKARVIRKKGSVSPRTVSFEVSNASKVPAVAVRFNAVDSNGEIVLPAYFSEGYINLLPGEKRIVELELEDADFHGITAEGYNVNNKTIL